MDDDLEFWRRFRQAGAKKTRKFLFMRTTPFSEVKEQYIRLMHDARKKGPEYQAVCLLALAKSEEERGSSAMDEATTQKLQHTTSTSDLMEFLSATKSNSANATAKMLTSTSRGQGELGRRRCEYARWCFSSLVPFINFQSAMETVSVPFWSYVGTEIEERMAGEREGDTGDTRRRKLPATLSRPSSMLQGSFLALPVAFSYYAPVVLAPLALQSYILAVQVYLLHSKITMAASLRYEMAVQLERMGESGAAASQWQQAAQELLLQSPFTRSLELLSAPKGNQTAGRRNGRGGQAGQAGGRKAKSKRVVKAPITAYCALRRAMESNLKTADYSRACANGLKIIEIFEAILPDTGVVLPGQDDIVAETKITLLLLYCIQRDFSNAHKLIQQLTEHTTQASSQDIEARGGATSPQMSRRKHSVASSRGWLLQVGFGPTNLLLSFYDFVMAFEERDVWAMEEVVHTLYPYLSRTQQSLMLLIVDQFD